MPVQASQVQWPILRAEARQVLHPRRQAVAAQVNQHATRAAGLAVRSVQWQPMWGALAALEKLGRPSWQAAEELRAVAQRVWC